MRYETKPMKTHLKVISCFAVMAIACGGLCLTDSVRAQSAPQPSASPDATRRKTPLPRLPLLQAQRPRQRWRREGRASLLKARGHRGHSKAQVQDERLLARRKRHDGKVQLRIDSGDLQPEGSGMVQALDVSAQSD